MEKFLLKRRKISEPSEPITCDICYNDFSISNIVLCFHNCTIKTCNECLTKQLKIEKTRRIHNAVNKEIYSIYYTCSMCQQKSYYRKIRDTEGGALLAKQYRFTNWVQNNPSILINLLEKFINPVIPEVRPPETPRNDEEDFEQYDLFLSTAFYINDIITPNPSTLPFPYRLLTPSSTILPPVTQSLRPVSSAQSAQPSVNSAQPRSLVERFRGSGSPTESSIESSDEAQ